MSAPSANTFISVSSRATNMDAMTETKLLRNPCAFAYRFNYLALRYNTPCYDWIQQTEGLSRIDYVVVYSLALFAGGQARDIARSSGFPKNSLSRAIVNLERLGYIRRDIKLSDRRNQPLYLTAEGRDLFERTLPALESVEQQMLACLSKKEQATLLELLGKVVLHCADNPTEISVNTR